MEKILIVDDDHSLTQTLTLYFEDKGYEVVAAETGEEALESWKNEEPDLVLMDVHLPDIDGPEVLAHSQKEQLKGEVIMITAFQDSDATLSAIRLGAIDYLYKPLDLDALDLLIKKTIYQKRTRERLRRVSHLISEEFKPNQIIGRSEAILQVIKSMAKVARTPTTVLIEGETGTGKELVARTIHQESRQGEPFVAINCAAIVGTLLESELFGYEQGAFTGANRRTIGKLEFAGNGTVFLDEISELPLDLQATLLRVLQEKEFQRVGGVKNIELHARILVATNRDLQELVKQKKFREDLYFRLQVYVIKTPPLRERPGDIVPLAEYFLSRLNGELHKKVLRIPNLYLEAMKGYDWPGNVRELENVLRRGIIHSKGEMLELDLEWLKKRPAALSEQIIEQENPEKPKSLEEVEKEHILRVLRYTNGNYGEACGILGITRPTLRKKIRAYRLSGARFR